MPHTNKQLDNAKSDPRPFTGREDAIDKFEDAFKKTSSDRQNVLFYYGVAGIGKTSIIKKLRHQLSKDREEVAHVRLDFRDPKTHRLQTALMRMRGQLHDNYDIPFPTFDIAFTIYWKLANPHLPLTQSNLRFLDEGEIAAEIISALGDAPVIGWAAKIPRILNKVSNAANKWYKMRGSKDLQRIAELDDPTELAEWLPAFWGSDVIAWLKDSSEHHLVLFFDTYESLLAGRSQGTYGTATDEWLRELAGHLPGVLIVICGRSKLCWADYDESWGPYIEEHHVGSLAKEDCDHFLSKIGVIEDDIREVIIIQSKGVPLYLDLAVDTYRQIQQNEKRVPKPEEFRENLETLLFKFLHYLDKQEQAALYKLSVPETFDIKLFKGLMKTFGTGYPATTDGLDKLCRFSFIEKVESEWYSLHSLVRETLETNDDPEEREKVHNYLFEQAKKTLEDIDVRTINDKQRRALRDGFIHGRVVMAPDTFWNWYWEFEKPFEKAGEWQLLRPFRENMLKYAIQIFGTGHHHTLVSVNDLAVLNHKRGNYKEAESLYQRALDGLKQNLGNNHPATLTTMNNLADLFRSQGRYKEAEPLSRSALKGAEQVHGENHQKTLIAVGNLAKLLEKLEKYEEAELLHNRALEGAIQTLGETHHLTFIFINNFAVLLENQGRHSEAEPLYRKVLKEQENELGDKHPHTLASINNLALLLSNRECYEEAVPLHRKALEGAEQMLGKQHPYTLTSVNNLALSLAKIGYYEEAELLFRRALKGRKHLLGSEHPDTNITRKNLKHLLRESKNSE